MATAVTAPHVELIKLSELFPSPNNPRKHFDEEKLKELAESLKAGQIEPIVVRAKHANQKEAGYEILAGERRFRAAGIAGLTVIEAKILDVTDQRALEITVVENLQRENLHPLEEANGVASLVKAGWPIDTIAAHLGKSLSWVYLRSKLAGLSEKWRKAIDDPRNDVSLLTAGHLDLVARLPAVTQDELLHELANWSDVRRAAFPNDQSQPVSVQAFGKLILQTFLRDPAKAPWAEDDKGLTSAPACGECPLRASRQQTLFPDHEGGKGGDRCTDHKCWKAKQAAFVDRRAKILAEKHPDLVKVDQAAGHGEKPIKGALSGEMVSQAKKSDPGAKPTLIVNGPGAGEVVYTAPSYYGRHDASARKAFALPAKDPEPTRSVGTKITGKAKPKKAPIPELRHRFIAGELVERLNKAKRPPLARLVRLVIMVGTSGDGDYASLFTVEGWKRIDNPKRTAEHDTAAMWEEIIEALRFDLEAVRDGESFAKVEPAAMAHIAELLGADHGALVAAAAAKHPDVKEGVTAAKTPVIDKPKKATDAKPKKAKTAKPKAKKKGAA